jgi:hypothetical protein
MAQCPACGFDNPDSQKFCGECGTRLIPAAAAERVPPSSTSRSVLAAVGAEEELAEMDQVGAAWGGGTEALRP